MACPTVVWFIKIWKYKKSTCDIYVIVCEEAEGKKLGCNIKSEVFVGLLVEVYSW